MNSLVDYQMNANKPEKVIKFVGTMEKLVGHSSKWWSSCHSKAPTVWETPPMPEPPTRTVFKDMQLQSQATKQKAFRRQIPLLWSEKRHQFHQVTVQMVQGSTSGQFSLPMWALPSLQLKSREGGHDKNILLKSFFVFHLCKILTAQVSIAILRYRLTPPP